MSKYSRYCILCDNKQPRAGRSTCSFHKFPADLKTRSLWIKFCNLTDLDNVSNITICSDHFTSKDYVNYRSKQLGGSLKLKFGAVPSIRYPKRPKHNVLVCKQHIASKEDNLELVNVESTTSDLSPTTIPPTLTLIYQDMSTQANVIIPCIDLTEENTALASVTEVDDSTASSSNEGSIIPKRKRFSEPRYIGDIKSPDVATRKRARRSLTLAKVVAIHSRKIRTLQEQNRSLRKKINCLKDLVNHLQNKNLISNEDADTLLYW